MCRAGRNNSKKEITDRVKSLSKTSKSPKQQGGEQKKKQRGKERDHLLITQSQKTANTKFNQEENNSEEEREKRERKKLCTEAKAKKAAEAKVTKEALLKQRLEQAKKFQISQQSWSSSHGDSHEVIGSESDQSDAREDEYFPKDGAMHADGDDDLIELEVTWAYSSPLKELFQTSNTMCKFCTTEETT